MSYENSKGYSIVTHLYWVSNFKSNIWVDNHKHPLDTNCMTYQTLDACGRTFICAPQTCQGRIILILTKDTVLSVWDLGTNYCFYGVNPFSMLQCFHNICSYNDMCTIYSKKEEWRVCTLLLLCVMQIGPSLWYNKPRCIL
mgnify:CR=1 FL=1